MKKFAVVLGVVAIATLSGCKDPDYVGKRRPAEPATPIDTTPVPATPAVVQQPVAPAPAPVVQPPAPVVTPKPIPPAVEPEYTVYIVQPGDYLSKISAKYNISMSAIRKLNPSMKKDIVRVGQRLKLPGKVDVGVQAPAAAPKPAQGKTFKPYDGATKEYVVQNGDTLGSIAYSNGMNIRQLKQLNGLTGDSLRIGQKLKIAADGKSVAKAPKAEKGKGKSAKKPAADAKAPAAPAADAKAPTVPVADEKAPAADATPADAAPAADPAPAAPETATTDYIVQEGDDVTGISISCQTTPAVIRELNKLGPDEAVKPGQTIKVPADNAQ